MFFVECVLCRMCPLWHVFPEDVRLSACFEPRATDTGGPPPLPPAGASPPFAGPGWDCMCVCVCVCVYMWSVCVCGWSLWVDPVGTACVCVLYTYTPHINTPASVRTT